MANDSIALSAHKDALAAKDAEMAALSTQHKDAVTALEAKHAVAVSAFEAKIKELSDASVKAKADLDGVNAALAAKTKELEDAAKYDMRKAGAPALEIALNAHRNPIPAPAANDTGKWEQYAELCEKITDKNGNVLSHKETPAAREFKAKYLSRK